MSWILPKGIVVNSPEIEGSIERINTEPLDLADIAKFWKVYTTTKRRLLDPTAERLENYWWRIWGSQKRELNGATVASLFATISNGESFVPLRGPPNRDEGTSPSWERARPRGSGASSTTALNRQGQGQVNSQSNSQSRPSTTSSSVSKSAATPHPILKKSRGPSTTGPRPTARFISPHESENDQDSGICENSHVVVQPPSPDRPTTKPEKKSSSGNGGRKSRAAVPAPSAKRPVVFRRKSSPSSTESPSRSVETGSSGVDSSLETPSPAYIEADDDVRKSQSQQSRFREKFSPVKRLSSSSGAKHSTKSTDSKRLSPPQTESTSPMGPRNTFMEDSGVVLSADKRRTSEGDLTANEANGLEPRRTRPLETTARDSLLAIGDAPKRSQSDMFQRTHKSTDNIEPRDAGPIRYLSNDTKSTPSLAPTLTDASGQLAASKGAESSFPKSSSSIRDKGKRRASDESKSARSTRKPTSPTNENDDKGAFTKSKSQLELVLEKDRARNGDKKSEGRG